MARNGNTSQTVRRLVRILQLVPQGKKVDAARIQRQLASEGMHVQLRSVQRELEQLADLFPGLECDRRFKPYGWSWSKKAPLAPAPGLFSAVILELVRRHLLPALPRETLRELEPYLAQAREILRRNPPAPLCRWLGKVRVASGSQLHDIPCGVQDAVYAALLEDRRLRVTYRPGQAGPDEQLEIDPLGIVVRPLQVVLVCARDGRGICQLPLHRLRAAEVLDAPATAPDGFNLDDYVPGGGLQEG